jgi:starch phosphorylase
MTLDHNRIPYLPARVEGLATIAMNLSWSWKWEARQLFEMLDPNLWHLTRHNPVAMLRRVDPGRLNECAREPQFLEIYDRVMAELEAERSYEGTWFAKEYSDLGPQHPVAYFCAEFGLHNSVPIYSGGLGVLAGDHCKAASELGVPLVGVGMLYTRGYFDQKVRPDGWQEDGDEQFDIMNAPLERMLGPSREPYLARVITGGREVYIGAWRMQVGRVPVFLLDTNLEENHEADRDLTGKLYIGGPEVRLRQEWILGVGGVRLLRALGIQPAAWHANEGHATFMMVERLRELVQQGASFEEAVREVRRRSTFTTHTPVPAGHDSFSNEALAACSGPIWEELKISKEAFFEIGAHPTELHDHFHMTVAALRLAKHVNGVSRRHGEVSRQLWASLWPDRPVEKVPLGHITNGVHLETWMAAEVRELLDRHLGKDWLQRADDPATWESVLQLDDVQLWRTHLALKGALMAFIREDARRRWTRYWSEPSHVVGAGTLLNPEALTIGFARRFATYKRADLVFRDIERLRRILVDPVRPVQIIFAGKAHPADTPGKEVLKTVYNYTRDQRLEGRVAFLEDYELHLAHRLVQGVDLWLNLPRIPLEACGTSGMKAALNGVPQLSTLDGWWYEGYTGLNGWAIPPATARSSQDDWDAEWFYRLLEEQIVPLYYARDASGVPRQWVERMKHAMRVAGERFSARRMVKEYAARCYAPSLRGNSTPDDPPSA